MSSTYEHQPVLLKEVIEQLVTDKDGIYIDATFGRGGHSQAILQQLGSKGSVLAIDRDPVAVQVATTLIGNHKQFAIAHSPFSALKKCAMQHNIVGKVNGVLFDLGVSSPQLDDAERGFSFMQDGPLDMRMDPTQGLSAATWIKTAREDVIANVLWEYGEERFSKRIARAIVETRRKDVIATTKQLAQIIAGAIPVKEKHKHPATRSFQAIRIYINAELNELEAGLEQSLEVLKVGGRLAVISFHSLEDRIVKRFIRKHEKGELDDPLNLMPMKMVEGLKRLRHIGKVIKPSDEEIRENARSRSAVLRIAEKIS